MILENSVNYDRINQLHLTAECKALFCNWLTEQNQCLNNQTTWRTRLYCQLQFSTQAQADRSDTVIIKGNAFKKISVIISPSFCTQPVCTDKIYHSFKWFLLSGHPSHGDMHFPPSTPIQILVIQGKVCQTRVIQLVLRQHETI